ncbi:MAG: hypothetical protein ACI4QO_04655 [Clostridia bacterium]
MSIENISLYRENRNNFTLSFPHSVSAMTGNPAAKAVRPFKKIFRTVTEDRPGVVFRRVFLFN